LLLGNAERQFPPVAYTIAKSLELLATEQAMSPRGQQELNSSEKNLMRHPAVAVFLFCVPPLTWIATGLLAGWLAVRRGKSWRRGFVLGFFLSTPGVVVAALPRGSSPRDLFNVNPLGAIRRFFHSLIASD
jgi:hypothetical protein